MSNDDSARILAWIGFFFFFLFLELLHFSLNFRISLSISALKKGSALGGGVRERQGPGCPADPGVSGAEGSDEMSEKQQPVDLGLLEEDNEFEVFPAEDWAGLHEDEDAHVWEDNWDDDNVEDDFSK
ncbi:26S proteasome complex subunit SEM1 [Carlito syrichta]|uniref:26S proteasome complex subunit SEM1 n=1 Tax=Carlito syrichta TaxID=1868482 RepID=A0A3Q0DZK2_CARSF|nr:26S proteasome complex subunit SEM1 [Carlito syrichta]